MERYMTKAGCAVYLFKQSLSRLTLSKYIQMGRRYFIDTATQYPWMDTALKYQRKGDKALMYRDSAVYRQDDYSFSIRNLARLEIFLNNITELKIKDDIFLNPKKKSAPTVFLKFNTFTTKETVWKMSKT